MMSFLLTNSSEIGEEPPQPKIFFIFIWIEFVEKVKVKWNVLTYLVGYLGDELNQACVGNGTSAESESFVCNIVKIIG